MLTTSESHSGRAVSISFSWPACKAPMVGTKPIVPADASASRISLTVWTACTYFLDIRACRRENLISHTRVLLSERRRRVGQTECVITDQDLSVALVSRADSNRRNFDAGRNPARKIGGNRFEDNGEHTGFL